MLKSRFYKKKNVQTINERIFSESLTKLKFNARLIRDRYSNKCLVSLQSLKIKFKIIKSKSHTEYIHYSSNL